MIFGIKEFNELTRGVVKIENKREAFQFYRFNDAEMEHYAPTNHLKKSYATAGVEICALTDATAVSIAGNIRPGSSRSYFSFDVLVNGELVGEIKNFEHCEMVPDYTEKPFDIGEFSGRVELPSGKKELRVVFPWSVAPDISRFELEGASFVEPIAKEKRMIIYGDSITQGYDAENPSRSYASRLARALNADALNKGIGGEFFCPDLADIKNDNDPDIITVAYGTNDWSRRSMPEIVRNASAFYSSLSEHYPKAKIFAISPIWRQILDEPDYIETFMQVSRLVERIASKHDNIIHIEGIDLVPHDTGNYADVRLHPRNIGFDFYADNLIKKIKEHI
jgi:hypothetical protein